MTSRFQISHYKTERKTDHLPTIFPGEFCIKFSAHKVRQIDCREPTVTVDGMHPKVLKELANVTKSLKVVATEGSRKD